MSNVEQIRKITAKQKVEQALRALKKVAEVDENYEDITDRLEDCLCQLELETEAPS